MVTQREKEEQRAETLGGILEQLKHLTKTQEEHTQKLDNLLKEIPLSVTSYTNTSMTPFRTFFNWAITAIGSVLVFIVLFMISLSNRQQNLPTTQELEDLYIDKYNYYQLQKVEHDADINALCNPKNAREIYNKLDQDQLTTLKLNFIGNTRGDHPVSTNNLISK
jgi:hypothetical protein